MQVTIVGTGYVGLVTGVCLASKGHYVTCVDVLSDRVKMIKQGEVPFHEPGLASLIKNALSNRCLCVTTDLEQAILGSDVSIIAVGTPPAGEDIDLSDVETSAAQVGQALRYIDHYHVVVVKSTVVPGTTDTLVRSTVEKNAGRRVGEFGLCMNPEFLREGSAVNDFMYPDRIVIGQWDKNSGRVLEELYCSFGCPKLYTTLRNAELMKYASNALLSVIISFSNEIASLCEATPGTDIETVMDGLHLDRRLSPIVNGQRISPNILSYLRAGAGFGGSCLPKDVDAIRTFARTRHLEMPLLDATIQVNKQRPKQVVALVEQALCGLCGCTVAVLGLAFKPGTDDLRSSPALTMIEFLLNRGAVVQAYDPMALSAAKPLFEFDPRVTLCSTPQAAVTNADAALIATAWPEFTKWNWHSLCEMMHREVIVDGRNTLRDVQLPGQVLYYPIGAAIEK